MLCIHFIQPWFILSGPAMEEALYDMVLSSVPGVSESLCKRFGLQLTEMRSLN